jgi:hypothetical protein
VHAYAADDPLFVAMNARGQRETGGALGDFCVRCHAPLALARGLTRDGSNLASLPAAVRGVTCVVCHTGQVGPGGTLQLGDDGIMRGPLADALSTPAHGSAYSPAHDREQPDSATFCGACHVVTNAHGLEVERTLEEWRATTYAAPSSLATCGRCHMAESSGQAAEVAGAPSRTVHGHAMPGVDVGAGSAAQRQAVETMLAPAISARLCVVPSASSLAVTVTVENLRIGHAWPSGATQNRRAWLELVGYRAGAVVYRSGVVADGQAVTSAADPPLLLLREQLFDDAGAPAPFMWSAVRAEESLLASATADPGNAVRTATAALDATIDEVTARVLIRPVDRDVTDLLVASGDLSPATPTSPTFEVRATDLEWTADRGAACLP